MARDGGVIRILHTVLMSGGVKCEQEGDEHTTRRGGATVHLLSLGSACEGGFQSASWVRLMNAELKSTKQPSDAAADLKVCSD